MNVNLLLGVSTPRAHPVPSVAQGLGGLWPKWMGQHLHFMTSAPPTPLLPQFLCTPGTPSPAPVTVLNSPPLGLSNLYVSSAHDSDSHHSSMQEAPKWGSWAVCFFFFGSPLPSYLKDHQGGLTLLSFWTSLAEWEEISWHATCLAILFLLQHQAKSQRVTAQELRGNKKAALCSCSLKRSWALE